MNKYRNAFGGTSRHTISPVSHRRLRAAPGAHRVILGVDPSLRGTGYGADFASPSRIRSRWRTATIFLPGTRGKHSRCLRQNFADAARSFARTPADRLRHRRLFFAQNLQTAIVIGRGTGRGDCGHWPKAGLEIYENRAAQGETGPSSAYGADAKIPPSPKMVQRLLNLPKPPAPDAADALALAIAHAQEKWPL